MRAIITALFLILFSQSAGAMDNESLYKNCKLYSDNNFELTDDSSLNLKSLICQTYITAIGDVVNESCFGGLLNLEYSNIKADFKYTDIYAIIQSYVNDMRESPEEWKYYASESVVKAILSISGECPN